MIARAGQRKRAPRRNPTHADAAAGPEPSTPSKGRKPRPVPVPTLPTASAEDTVPAEETTSYGSWLVDSVATTSQPIVVSDTEPDYEFSESTSDSDDDGGEASDDDDEL